MSDQPPRNPITAHYFPNSDVKPYADTKKKQKVVAAMNLNEIPYDIPEPIKQRVLERLKGVSWSRYPDPYGDTVIPKLAQYVGVDEKQIAAGPGSSALIRLLFNFFGINATGDIVVTRPSFAYYEEYCKSFRLQYKVWELDNDYEYDLSMFPAIKPYSIVFVTSPNNPTGNLLARKDLEHLLKEHELSLFVLDEAYVEFTNESMVDLVETHPNLLVLRTFSKTFAGAGIRFGYLVGQKELVQPLKGLLTPWQLSAFTLLTVDEILNVLDGDNYIQETVKTIVAERERMIKTCKQHSAQRKNFTLYPSVGNFFLLKFHNEELKTCILDNLHNNGVLVRDFGRYPGLEGCVRVTVGTEKQNSLFLKLFAACIESGH